MKLLGTVTSPYVRKIRIVLAEKKIDCEFQIAVAATPDGPVMHYNPLARVPVLVLDDDSALFDSPVIAEYLDNAAPNSKLIPQPNRERIAVRQWESLADGITDAAVALRVESLRPAAQQSPEAMARNQAAIQRGMLKMDADLGDQPFCMGTHISLADIAVGSALGYLDFRFGELKWREYCPNLGRLFDKLMQRPSFADTAPHD